MLIAWPFALVAQDSKIEILIRELDQKNALVAAKADAVLLMELLKPQFTINAQPAQ